MLHVDWRFLMSRTLLNKGARTLTQKEASEFFLNEKIKEARLKNELLFDDFAEMYNTKGFYYFAQRCLLKNTDKKYAMVRLDISRFMFVNEFVGRTEATRLLLHISELIRSFSDEYWCTSHFRADTFAFCMPYESESDIVRVVESMADSILNFPIACKILPSFGICLVDDPYIYIEVLCDYAKIALNTIKDNILQNYAFYADDLHKQLLHEKKIENRINYAVKNDEFNVYLQPKINMKTRKIYGAEALVRWNTDGTVLTPDYFIPTFEKNGFIINLDEIVWRKVFLLLKKWKDLGYELIPISINVSRLHAVDIDFINKIFMMAEETGISSSYIKLELTESAFLDTSSTIYEMMKELQLMGYTFSMDDFGCGYSSLNLLQNISIDEVKLDKGFLDSLESSSKSRIVIKSTIEMLNRLNLSIVAEGVENQQQAEFLIECGCENAQGYYYYKPMPVEEFEKIYFNLC